MELIHSRFTVSGPGLDRAMNEYVRALERRRLVCRPAGVGLFTDLPLPVIPLILLDILPPYVQGALGDKDDHPGGIASVGNDEPGYGGVRRPRPQ
jgi:hypothetical protein